MKRFCAGLLALVVLGGGAVRAAPPTVVPSPGYDARLQEQRAASSHSVAPDRKPVTRRHKRVHAR